jgi:hypothetical protein
MPRAQSGWVNPSDNGYHKLTGTEIWEYQWPHPGMATSYPQIGIFVEYTQDPNGNQVIVQHPFWEIRWCIFAGVDVGEDIDVDNPAAGHQFSDGPAPILLDTDTHGDYPLRSDGTSDADAGVRRELFTLLGVAGTNNAAAVWPSRFAPAGTQKRIVCFAQARVFNNVSWDLWTQAWQAQLSAVTKFSGQADPDTWMSQLAAERDRPIVVDGRAMNLQPYYNYLSSIPDETVAKYLNH